MAFNFLGIFEEEEMDTLLAFAKDQAEDVEGRISRLRGEIRRRGWLQIQRDEDNTQTGFVVVPRASLTSKLVRSYQYYGGSVLDLNIISRGDWIYFSKDRNPSMDERSGFTGRRPVGADYNINKRRNDTGPAIVTKRIKDWMKPAVKRKREKFEYKIKRNVDYVDQQLEKIIDLVQRTSGAETLDDLEGEINSFINNEDVPSAGKQTPALGLPEDMGEGP